MIRRALLALAACTVLAAAEPAAKPLLHPLFSDHAVVQRDRPLPVWGWAAPGQEVAVTFADRTAKAVAAADGRWLAKLDPLPANAKPQVLTVTAAGTTATASDLLIGDVWICSGQSNMEMGINQANDAAKEIAAASHPTMRLCVVAKQQSTIPLELTTMSWKPCTPENVAAHGTWGGFSAVGYFFGRKLVQEVGVPIGLVQTAWGGTSAEAWSSESALRPLKDFDPALEAIAAELAGTAKLGQAERESAWWQKADPGTAAGWMAPGFADSEWKSMELPGQWEQAGLPDFDGVVWFRRHVEFPAAWAGKELSFTVQGIDDEDTVFLDGERIGGGRLWDRRDYRIAAAKAVPGPHVLAIRVLDTGGGGGVIGKADQFSIGPVGGGDRLALAGAWRHHVGPVLASMPPPPVDLDKTPGGRQNVATALFNAMINPLLPASISGVIWYQGEANACNAKQYRSLLPALITDWRARFQNPAAPFLVVQLVSFMERKGPVEDGWWPDLREAQALTARKLPKVGLACGIDIGEGGDIHPKNKQDVGLRLALQALKLAYGKDVEASGPVYEGFKAEGDAVRISFTHAKGLRTGDGKPPLAFALAGADGAWVAAEAVIDGETVVLRAPGLAAPTRARYAWANNPAVNLINGAGLPGVPFRTDAP